MTRPWQRYSSMSYTVSVSLEKPNGISQFNFTDKRRVKIFLGCVQWWWQLKCPCEHCNEGMCNFMEHSRRHSNCCRCYEYMYTLILSKIYINFYMYLPSVLQFYNLRVAVRVKMCTIDTVNGTLGMERGFGNELPGPEFNLGHIKFSFSSAVYHIRREADHSHPSKTEEKNEWIHTSTHFHIGIQQESFHVR
jgi:hypothetical protein